MNSITDEWVFAAFAADASPWTLDVSSEIGNTLSLALEDFVSKRAFAGLAFRGPVSLDAVFNSPRLLTLTSNAEFRVSLGAGANRKLLDTPHHSVVFSGKISLSKTEGLNLQVQEQFVEVQEPLLASADRLWRDMVCTYAHREVYTHSRELSSALLADSEKPAVHFVGASVLSDLLETGAPLIQPVDKHEQLLTGLVGWIGKNPVYTDAYRHPLIRVLEPTDMITLRGNSVGVSVPRHMVFRGFNYADVCGWEFSKVEQIYVAPRPGTITHYSRVYGKTL
jgi:hypothetical protein